MPNRVLGLKCFFLLFAVCLLILPGRLAADEPPQETYPQAPGWQMLINREDGAQISVPLPLDYTIDGVAYTLDDPYLPLRPLAEAAGVDLRWRSIEGHICILWAEAAKGRVFVAGQPLALHIYRQEEQWLAAAEQQFEQPRLLDGSFCVPLSFLDCLGLAYDLDPAAQTVTVYVTAADPADPEEQWPAAEPLLQQLLAPKQTLLAAAKTHFNSRQLNRSQNILLAAGALHGLVVPPGGEFSFNRAVGARTVSRGYKSAPIFNDGQTVMGIGGGVCQVSTTVYQAAAAAGMKITERHLHSLPVSYTKSGADATVVWGYKDLRWQNTTAKPVVISCRAEGGTLSVELYQLNTPGVGYLGQVVE